MQTPPVIQPLGLYLSIEPINISTKDGVIGKIIGISEQLEHLFGYGATPQFFLGQVIVFHEKDSFRIYDNLFVEHNKVCGIVKQ